MKTEIEFTRISNNINGNPRYVCHFLNLIKEGDEAQIKDDFYCSLLQNPFGLTGFMYDLALERAKKIGGKRFHNKQYGGGIVFQSYNIDDTKQQIINLIA